MGLGRKAASGSSGVRAGVRRGLSVIRVGAGERRANDAKFGPLFSAQGEGFKPSENPIDAALIGIGCIISEPFRSVSVKLGQVGTRSFA